uniref:U6 small nuclear RNA (adenine-(43)-N(6))-methyltransferase n=1 Tax=Neolamprologus brichardi TaxID=32507 RepID=A0A3Q4MIE3_NEOBR
MALNKSMHPRNRYKDKPPDFAYLASKYPDFQQHVHTSLTGKPIVNFKEPEAVRALTCTLLKEDFGLAIEIPLERLIPTVPLRLNYIHWVEDLIDGQKQPRRGIDIGTGASCIYPLLGATMNGWYFLATEVDDICFDYATKNVEQNNLSDLVKVVKVPQKTLLMDALKEETEMVYDFCMCNPPFFANQLEAKGVNSRNSRRPPPSSVNTGGVTEIMAEGGELEFVKRIIHDSLQLKKRLRWYSCMLGKKCSLAPLKEELRKQGVPKVTHTEFCQGRTMRWALAWSFYDDVVVPVSECSRVKVTLCSFPQLFVGQSAMLSAASLLPQTPAVSPMTGEQKEAPEKVTGEDVDMESSTCTGTGQEADLKETPAAASEPPSKRPVSPSTVKHFLFKCLLNVIQEQSDVVIEMHWVEGLNRDLMNQLCTYLKNTLLKTVAKS